MALRKKKNMLLCDELAKSFLPTNENSDDDENSVKVENLDQDEDIADMFKIPKLSQIRKKNIKMLSDQSDKYLGEAASRELHWSDSSDDDDSSINEEFANDSNGADDNMYDEQIYVAKGSETDATSPEEMESVNEENKILSSIKKVNDAEKSSSVHNQLKIWEKLLECRIHSNKILNKTNSLPLPPVINKMLCMDQSFSIISSETSSNVQILINKLMELQNELICTNSQSYLKNCKGKRSNQNYSIDYDEPPLKKLSLQLEKDFRNSIQNRNIILKKWDDRMKLLTPGRGSKYNSDMDEFNIIKKIENTLLSKNELIEKSQKVKGSYTVLSTIQNNSESENNSISFKDIYDDSDFYHQQLRELIEFKSGSNSSDIIENYNELQKLRQKMKKKMDTRATKGRKIRYIVHNKLVNFMAPDNEVLWTDPAKDELYRSLFST